MLVSEKQFTSGSYREEWQKRHSKGVIGSAGKGLWLFSVACLCEHHDVRHEDINREAASNGIDEGVADILRAAENRSSDGGTETVGPTGGGGYHC